MPRLFGALTLLAFCALLGYVIVGNVVGMVVFGIFTLIFAGLWLGGSPTDSDDRRA